ncbi:BTAD domain-containing putative transcriptional regulator [Actinokineospora spheciospongiae]|uniref:BTAD domain-containing putative transcriptional regulator n=1 Tax=Actinokineospora spheciospongiae TaxID=909613 RepID=UPI000D710EFB|nr:BTAD domain-containing putative transcriptional regulator [Actinokineospora spheciospongiae]PWW65872.1 putative ATPase [Actinokineospora spheciospongiae]
MRVAMLGPVRVTGAGAVEVELGGARLRMLLARLALDAGRVVTSAALIDSLWGDEPPADAVNALQSLVSRLRRALRAGADGLVESSASGYRLVVDRDDVDVHRFERLAAEGRLALREGRPTEAAAALRAALELWRGPALSGLADAPFAGAAITRLTELRVAALEDRLAADVDLGGHADTVAELHGLVAEHPLRERAAGLLVRALYLSGRQAEALAAHERIRRALAEELGVEPSAELRDLHLAVLRGDLAPAAPAAVPTPALTSFVGRRVELAEVRGLLASARLVTLVGPGGAGKTRLSCEAVAGSERPTWLVELAAVRAAEDVPGAVLAALGARETRLLDAPGGTPPRPGRVLDRVVEMLSAQRGVLVLDNCEHLVEAAAALADAVLARCPRLTVLATSREPLAITGEVVFGVGPLGLPAERAEAAEVLAAEAVRLFADRAEAAAPGFAVAEHAPAVAEVCRRLDGLPLALELAAARLRSMTLGQVAERLDDRFRLLTGGSRTSLPRHRTLRAVVEWSWDLLEEPERVLAARLSVFPAPAAADWVPAVAADDTLLPAEDVVYVLASLVEKSLVQVAEGRDGQVRYRVLETVRAYAAERLAEHGAAETARVRAAFSRCALAFLDDAEPRLRGPDQVRWMARIAADQENVLAATRYAAEAGDADLATRLALRAGWFWMISGHHREAVNLMRSVVALPGPAPAHATATLRALTAFDDAAGMPDPAVLAELRTELAETRAMDHHPSMAMVEPMLAAFAGEVDEAFAGLARAAAHPDPWARAMAELGRAFLLENTGDLAGSEAAAAGALARFRELGDRWGQAMAIGQVAERRSLLGDHAGSIEAVEEAVRLVRELGAADELPGMLARLAIQRGRAGDLDGAERGLRAALRMLRERGTNDLGILVQSWLSTVLRQRGDLSAAVAEHEAVTARVATLENRAPHMARTLTTVGAQLAVATGDLPLALARLRTAAVDLSAIPDMPVVSAVAETAAMAWLAAGDPAGAAHLLGLSTAIRGAPDLGNPELTSLRAAIDERIGARAGEAAHAAAAALDRATALKSLHNAVSTADFGAPAE